ncbi:DeoR family transcriptional regulator [Iocasia frigidifontis]|uniref:DeoR family transcriptional regulator n=1 Tax=Iocasia fonsfrigidae TaxID=2682810 RepID=A0A8A7KCW9_9FIRM|nr:DeoR/GlpR family DNA-binding transcription regulator [Iocasia fonsfrigidae]QTL96727.1 DeoR family transcriptional regulator [Iocasia fonsfrigidae]
MLAEERRQEILRLLDNKDSVHVSDLSKILDVTEETIRRDLDVLDKKKLLKRIHGGAVPLVSNSKNELNFNIRQNKKIKEKKQIAAKAIELIEEGDTIFLDASSTSLFLARELKKTQNITVVTNSIRIIFELSDLNNITVISTGGILRPNSLSFVGPLANETLKKYFADKIFASCKGIAVDYGATDSNELEIEVKQNMIKQSKKVIILSDHSKVNEIGLTQFASIEEIDTLITDELVDKNSLKNFEEAGLTVL